MLASRFLSALALFSLASAQTSTATAGDSSPSTASSDSTPGAGSHGYTYIGCYNETTSIAGAGGVRALAGGEMVTLFSYPAPVLIRLLTVEPQISNTTQTTETCLNYCAAASMQYAGLEYGQECWCSPYLNTLSAQLNASACNLACLGNSSEICGGSLKISLYNLTGKASSKKSGAATNAVSWRYGLGAGMLAAALGAAL